jgi:hypothetical protein
MSYELKIMIKATICVLELVCLYHVLKHDRGWLVFIQLTMAILSCAI